ncbi:ankyrin repeat and SOCS box protein 13-like [Montipora capricornis]|uniref:ankyrin repeat and SOCS box protein 13-like n=1 Tax=Montipora capricornis TaxID=246305 RepID=UPI0035F0FFFF
MFSQKKIQKSRATKQEKSRKNKNKSPRVAGSSVSADALSKRLPDVGRLRNRKPSCPEILLHNTGLKGKQLPELLKLIKIGEADLNSLAIKGIFPLHEAVSKGLVDSAKVLLENATTVNVRNSEGSSPLDVAVETGNFECAELLIRHGASTENIKHGFVLRSRTLRKVSSST